MTEQLRLVGLPFVGKEQVPDDENVPAPLLVNVTVPCGADDVPPACVSATSAVHEVGKFTETEEGVQLTVVVVARLI